jgi:hypothetical protein
LYALAKEGWISFMIGILDSFRDDLLVGDETIILCCNQAGAEKKEGNGKSHIERRK